MLWRNKFSWGFNGCLIRCSTESISGKASYMVCIKWCMYTISLHLVQRKKGSIIDELKKGFLSESIFFSLGTISYDDILEEINQIELLDDNILKEMVQHEKLDLFNDV